MSAKKKGSVGGARPGAGRKKLLKDRVGLTVQFDGDLYERLADLSEKRDASIGSLVREAVAAYVKRPGRK